jgi:hypothetical protein
MGMRDDAEKIRRKSTGLKTRRYNRRSVSNCRKSCGLSWPMTAKEKTAGLKIKRPALSSG